MSAPIQAGQGAERYLSFATNGYVTEYQCEKAERRQFVKVGSTDAKQAEATARYQIYPDYFEFPPTDHDKEPNRVANFRFDLDQDGNVALAIEEANGIIEHFRQQYGVANEEWRIWFSGGKGVHLELLASALGLEAGHPKLPLIFKRLAKEIVETLGLMTVDLSIYCMKTGKPFRIENVRRENGNFKVPVTMSELTVENHDSFIQDPRELEDVRLGLLNEKLATRINEIISEIERQDKFVNSGPFWEYDSEDDPPCIGEIANNRRVTPGKCDFNLSAMTLTRYALSRGLSCDEALCAFAGFIEEFPSSSLGNSLSARKSNFIDRYSSMEGAGSEFSCGYARALGVRLGCELCSYFETDLEQRKENVIDSIQQKFILRQSASQGLFDSDWVPLLLEKRLENESDVIAIIKTRFGVASPAASIKEGLKHKSNKALHTKAIAEGKTIVYDRPERSLVAEDIARAIVSRGDSKIVRCNGVVCCVRGGRQA